MNRFIYIIELVCGATIIEFFNPFDLSSNDFIKRLIYGIVFIYINGLLFDLIRLILKRSCK